MTLAAFPEDVRQPIREALHQEAMRQGSIAVHDGCMVVARTWERIGIDIDPALKVCATITTRALDHLVKESRLVRVRGGTYFPVAWSAILESPDYEVSNLGHVRRTADKKLVHVREDKHGRRLADLKGKTHDVAKLTPLLKEALNT